MQLKVTIFGVKMESRNTCTQEEPQEQKLKEEEQMLRTRISTHPLYGLLLETHLNCLKVGSVGQLDCGYLATDSIKRKDDNIRCLNSLNQSELDCFMESYCFALSKLKEAMEESQLKSMAFINNMHSQLSELRATDAAPKKPANSSSSDTN